MFDWFFWVPMPFHFWSVVYALLGAMVGSFLNVCIYRMPHGASLVRPGSRCPKCGRPIPWRHNIPVLSWLWLRGRCAKCSARISPRYLLVELLTAGAFLGVWLAFGERSWPLACVYCVLVAGLIGATFIDLDHFIIPDEFTLGGIVAGFVASFAVPALHGAESPVDSMRACLIGAALGGGLIYGILRLGKLLFGRQRIEFAEDTRLFFNEEHLALPGTEIPYEEVFYRKRDCVALDASRVELPDRCFWNVRVRLTRDVLRIGDAEFCVATTPGFEAVTRSVSIPREAMGLGDVKFMAAIGAFVGWQGVLFSLVGSAFLGAAVGVALIAAGRRAWSSRIPYGPYIAVATTVWVFAGRMIVNWWLPPMS